MIKGVIDQLLEMPGYAGMAVYFAGACVYLDLLDGGLADDMYGLFERSSRDGMKAITAIVRGYSLLAFKAGDLVLVAKFEGRFVPVPTIYPDADEIAPIEATPRLPSREEARREAEELLRSFNILSRD